MQKKAIMVIMLTLLVIAIFTSPSMLAIARVDRTTSIRSNSVGECEFSEKSSSTNYSSPTYSASAQAEWNRTYGGADADSALSVGQTSDGGYIVAGGTASFGAGEGDVWLIKTDAYGNVEWNKTFGGPRHDGALSVHQTNDGGYIAAGHTYSFGAGSYDFWLVKTDAYGNMEWNRTYGGAREDVTYHVRQTSDGGYIAAGYTYSFGAGNYDVWLMKADTNGNMEWNKTYGGAADDKAYCVQQTSDGGYIVAAHTYSFDVAMGDTWLIKTDVYGIVEWSWISGWPDWDGAYSVQQTTDGGYIVAGYIFPSYATRLDFWLVKADSDGNMQWNNVYGGSGDEWAESVQQTSDGGYVLAGFTESFGAGLYDFWLVKTDMYGNMVWNKIYGGARHDVAYCVQQTSDGRYIVAGSTMSFGAGDEDCWLVKVLLVHDVAVTNIKPSKTLVGQGCIVSIYVTVENQGDHVESFNVTAYYDSTPIETQTVSNLTSGGKKTLIFTWNTTGVVPGNYTISAVADAVPGETETADNTYIDGTVEVRILIQDVAVTNVELEKTVVGQGYPLRTFITLVNEGDIPENFSVTAYANTTIVQTENVTLERGTSSTITLTWNTKGFAKGNYIISATAVLPCDNDPDDNTYVDGWVYVGLPGDVDADRDIDIYDIVMITSVYGSKRGKPLYNPNVDINDDGIINIYDVVIATSRYGEKEQ